jgi:hypothetical protein
VQKPEHQAQYQAQHCAGKDTGHYREIKREPTPLNEDVPRKLAHKGNALGKEENQAKHYDETTSDKQHLADEIPIHSRSDTLLPAHPHSDEDEEKAGLHLLA